ncbi:MAG TPA: hypothetical protein PKH56_07865, partial [Saprospiraceae bacterium]|nr:hypothetical protein [Saprospiraceae bacterium]
IVSATLSVPARLQDPPVRWYAALCCPDFPHPAIAERDEVQCYLDFNLLITHIKGRKFRGRSTFSM